MVNDSGAGSKERAHGIMPEISTPWSELRPQGINQRPLLIGNQSRDEGLSDFHVLPAAKAMSCGYLRITLNGQLHRQD